MKIIVLGYLVAQMKRLDALDTMQKTPTLKTVPLLKKSGKIHQKKSFKKKLYFMGLFLDFFSNNTLQRVEVFCVVISASRRFI